MFGSGLGSPIRGPFCFPLPRRTVVSSWRAETGCGQRLFVIHRGRCCTVRHQLTTCEYTRPCRSIILWQVAEEWEISLSVAAEYLQVGRATTCSVRAACPSTTSLSRACVAAGRRQSLQRVVPRRHARRTLFFPEHVFAGLSGVREPFGTVFARGDESLESWS